MVELFDPAGRRKRSRSPRIKLSPLGFGSSPEDGNENVGYGTSIRIDGPVQRSYRALGFTEDVPKLTTLPSSPAATKDGETAI